MARRPAQPGDRTGPAHLLDLISETVPPIHPKGLPFVLGPAAIAVVGRRRRWVSRPALALAGASAFFFRHPKRVAPASAGALVAPADGTVALVDTAVPPAELEMGTEPLPRISTFLSVFDVHVQRIPISGTVESVVHTPGEFLSADLPEASDRNERTSLRLRTDDGAVIGVVQIAGLIARRIVCDVAAGDRVHIGQTYGLIRFGSRVDVYLPAGTQSRLAVGQHTIGAETVLAELPR